MSTVECGSGCTLVASVPGQAYYNVEYAYKSIVSSSSRFTVIEAKEMKGNARDRRFILKREVKQSQFMGVGCIIFSILVMKVPDLLANTNELPTKALALAIVASTISVAAAVYTEVLFKSGCNSKDASSASFLEKQFWLYFYGMVTAAFIHGATFSTYGMTEFIHDMKVTKPYLLIMYVLALAFDSVGGIVVATVLKVLDNVVKEYSASAANLGTAISCAVFFPKKFQFSTYDLIGFARSIGLRLGGSGAHTAGFDRGCSTDKVVVDPIDAVDQLRAEGLGAARDTAGSDSIGPDRLQTRQGGRAGALPRGDAPVVVEWVGVAWLPFCLAPEFILTSSGEWVGTSVIVTVRAESKIELHSCPVDGESEAAAAAASSRALRCFSFCFLAMAFSRVLPTNISRPSRSKWANRDEAVKNSCGENWTSTVLAPTSGRGSLASIFLDFGSPLMTLLGTE
eukprot:maker-scaffold185_size275389-snap-gene-1.34 protein:Tk02519 transcript:maker-scaffold185_size275389-snap-gene-1.34-mRNA-1 annotation:"ZK370.7"